MRSAGLVSALTFVSRILGLVREGVCAYFFGAGAAFDAFAIAFRIPNLSRRLFGEGALSAAFIPLFATRIQRDPAAARRFLKTVLILQTGFLLATTLVLEAALAVARAFAPDSLLLTLTTIMLPYMVLICAVAVMAGALNVVGRFAVPALMPVLFNVLIIIAIVAAGPLGAGDEPVRIRVLAYAVLLAGGAQLGIQWLNLRRVQLAPLGHWDPRDPELRKLLLALAPTVIGLSAVQLNSLCDLLVAWIFVEHAGAASVLSYGERLYQFPLALCGAAIATAIFPQLSRLSAAEDAQAFSGTLSLGLRLALFVGIPASVGLWLVRHEAVRVIFEHGEFNAMDSQRAAVVVGCYGLGVWAYVLCHILVRACYALQRASTPMRISLAMVMLNLCLNLVLVQFLAEAGVAVATAITGTGQAVMLAVAVRRLRRGVEWGPVWHCLFRTLVAAALMFVAVSGLLAWLRPESDGVALGLAVGAGVLVFATVSKCLGASELRVLRQTLSSGNS